MSQQDRLKRHAALVDHMAAAMGVDLEEELFRGTLTPDQIPDAVLRCTACTDPEYCQSWLDNQQGTAETPPGFCRNTDVLTKIRNTAQARG